MRSGLIFIFLTFAAGLAILLLIAYQLQLINLCESKRRDALADILIVDDEEVYRDFIAEVVKRMGHTPVLASDGNEALDTFKRLKISLSIVDIRMPGMNGLEFLSRIKKTDPAAVIIMMTGFPSADTIVKTIEADGYTYITKPVQIDYLMDIIQRGLDAYRNTSLK
ncbi:MAG TPA: response regulator [bacterium]|nr:response regulator [bacterium]